MMDTGRVITTRDVYIDDAMLLVDKTADGLGWNWHNDPDGLPSKGGLASAGRTSWMVGPGLIGDAGCSAVVKDLVLGRNPATPDPEGTRHRRIYVCTPTCLHSPALQTAGTRVVQSWQWRDRNMMGREKGASH